MDTPAIQEQAGQARPPRSRLSFESVASRSAKYRPDVDGLRAVAVMAVLFFHLGIDTFRNGFVGVDIFYVISGYLITSLIAKDLAAGKFSLVTFYERRMRRIFPALFSVLFCCSLAAFVLFYPDELLRFGKSLFTTTLFISNFYFWHSALPRGYFDNTVPPPPLLHMWSLAVEEQFYLLFPLTLYLLFRWARGKVNILLFLFCASSFALNLWTTQHKPIVAFYWLFPRSWELLVGALLALKALPLIRSRLLREIVALLGILLIVVSITIPMNRALFPGYFVLLPCVGAGLVIYAGEAGLSLVAKALSLRPVVFIGVISYSLYLWHWPAIVFSQHVPFSLSGNAEIAFVLPFSVLAAFLSFEYIERPFRGSTSPVSRRQIFAFGLAASLLTAAFGLAATRSHGLPQRYDARTRQLIAANVDRMSDYDGSCSNWRTEVRSIADIKFCNLGDQSPHKIMFWGDSHVEQLYPAIQHLYSHGDLQDQGVVLAIESGCFPDQTINNRSDGYHCDDFARFAITRAQSQDVDVVFLGFSTWLTRRDYMACVSINGKCVTVLSRDALERRLLSDLADEIRTLKRSGKKVMVCLPFPIFSEPIPQVEINNAALARFGLSATPKDITSPAFREEIRAAAVSAGAEIFDPRETLCPDDHCITEIDGISIYKDESHLVKSRANMMESSLRSALQRSLAQQSSTQP